MKKHWMETIPAISGALLLFAFSGDWSTTPGKPAVRSYEIASRQWPSGADGLRILFFSDLHSRPADLRTGELGKLLSCICREAEQSDLVLFGGDLINSRLGEDSLSESEWTDFFRKIRAPLGVYAVFGNHDSDGDLEAIRRIYANSGVRLLENEVIRLQWRGSVFQLAGATYPHHGLLDWSKLLLQCEEKQPALFLSHHPDLFDDLPACFIGAFSGHTHGAQLRPPLVGARWLPGEMAVRYDWGKFEKGGKTLIVTCGLGTSNLKLRWNAPPELVRIRLRAL